MNLTQHDLLTARARRLLSDHRTRAKRDGVALDYTLADVRRLLESSPCCTYCGLPLSFSASLDHRQPIARGGKHALENLSITCNRCNRLKSILTDSEFRQLLTFLESLHPAARGNLERRLLEGGRRYGTPRRKTKDLL